MSDNTANPPLRAAEDVDILIDGPLGRAAFLTLAECFPQLRPVLARHLEAQVAGMDGERAVNGGNHRFIARAALAQHLARLQAPPRHADDEADKASR